MFIHPSCSLLIGIALKLRENWRKDEAHLPAPARLLGFTLIELSIVLVIIGLIVGGVLVGQDMIKAAESRAMASRMESFVAAHNTFLLKYNCMPGDCKNASTLGLGTSGDGNRRLAMTNGQCYGNDYGYSSVLNTVGVRIVGECQRYWVHLSNAELIPDKITDISSITYPTKGSNVGIYLPELMKDKAYVMVFDYLGKTYFRTGASDIESNSVYIAKSAIDGMQMGQILNKFSVDASTVTGCPTLYGDRHKPTNCLGAFKLPIIPVGFHTSYSPAWFIHTLGIGTGVKACMNHVSGKAVPQEDGQCNMLWRLN